MEQMRYRLMDEELVRIDLPGTKNLHIEGILRGSYDHPLVIMMHGRPGGGNGLLQYLGARYLYEQGFASLRLSMYSFEPNTRDLLDCKLQTHVDDFETVVDYVRQQGTKTVFGAGHSYGGLTILKSKAQLDGAVLWDPSHGNYWTEHSEPDPEFPEKTVGDIVVGLAGHGYVVSSAMNQADFAMGDTTTWAAGKGYPLEIISAEKGELAQLGKRYIEVADEPKRQVVVGGAHHSFQDSDEVTMELFKQTADWLKGIIND
ncbi:MAG: alpha/beta hydrolase [Candidatus Saccharimonadales bacterium]